MGIVRVQKNSNYSVISNVHLQDESLSWKAKGILSYLLSKPDNWQVYVAHLKNQSTDGRDATASGIRELIDAGYITRDYSRNEAGQITGRDYVVHEAALDEKILGAPVNKDDNPKTENPSSVDPTTVDPELLNTDIIKYGLKKNTDDVQTPPPPSKPVPIQKNPSSPSFSENNLVSILATLMAMIPEQHQKPSMEKIIEKGLSTHTEEYIRLAILYTTAHSNGGTWQKFKAYLGKCIDNNWHDGWEPDATPGDQGPSIDFGKIPDSSLKQLADAGNQQAIAERELRISFDKLFQYK